jgi:hypothetical protein
VKRIVKEATTPSLTIGRRCRRRWRMRRAQKKRRRLPTSAFPIPSSGGDVGGNFGGSGTNNNNSCTNGMITNKSVRRCRKKMYFEST